MNLKEYLPIYEETFKQNIAGMGITSLIKNCVDERVVDYYVILDELQLKQTSVKRYLVFLSV